MMILVGKTSTGGTIYKSLSWVKEGGNSHPLKMVPASSVEGFHDQGYSSQASDRWASLLAESIKASGKCTALSVVETSSGRYRVIDGKHRLQALGIIGGVSTIGVQVSP